jgi:hypothetical protein
MTIHKQGSIVRDESGIPLGGSVYVRVPRSHRKLNEFERRLGQKPQYYYSFRREGNFALVNGEQYERVRELVTRPRISDTSELLQCWDGK